MKKLFYFALMAGMAMCNISCGSDDDNSNDSGSGNTVPGVYKDVAATYSMNKPDVPSTVVSETNLPEIKGAKLKEVTFTEYGMAVIGIDVVDEGGNKKGDTKFATYRFEAKDNKYALKDKSNKEIGYIEKLAASSRASEEVTMVFNLSVSVEVFGFMIPLYFNSTSHAEQAIDTAISTYTDNVTNTWKVERMKLVLDFDEKTDVSTESNGGSLKPFLELADANDVKINENDRKQLDRTIESLIIDKTKMFVLKYADGRSDAATWKWVSESAGDLAIGINLKALDEGGNKFFNNKSKIAVELRAGNKINLILSTRLEDDKCTASLIVNLY